MWMSDSIREELVTEFECEDKLGLSREELDNLLQEISYLRFALTQSVRLAKEVIGSHKILGQEHNPEGANEILSFDDKTKILKSLNRYIKCMK